MRNLYISTLKPPEDFTDSSYTIDVPLYVEQMRQRWEDARIVFPMSGMYLVRWELDENVPGGLHNDKRTVSLGMNHTDSALNFILWHRWFVPGDVKLHLYDDNLTVIYDLTTPTTREELEQILGQLAFDG